MRILLLPPVIIPHHLERDFILLRNHLIVSVNFLNFTPFRLQCFHLSVHLQSFRGLLDLVPDLVGAGDGGLQGCFGVVFGGSYLLFQVGYLPEDEVGVHWAREGWIQIQ